MSYKHQNMQITSSSSLILAIKLYIHFFINDDFRLQHQNRLNSRDAYKLVGRFLLSGRYSQV
jgi:hypothetical protein